MRKNNLSKDLKILKLLILEKCFMCKFATRPVIIKNQKPTWNTEFMFHMMTTHGIPYEMFEIFNQRL